ncbi:MAG TPA: amidophosphoribosyltransferase [Thermodesulfobacterium commune]|uniref:Amidophosphoribosyltransferase n=1 Tax=Thermodesulfobacterium commune TaxID=1741 RepID=A0A3B8N627_9BACT|nr:MAG: Amidophosphoribosyltransferase [Thermodesulfobacterium commune]HAA83686.1 amidophosphoribosyltransferase [Thermodesulfobacterium commune]HCE80361.1 amidophosphoribosyltransferase [Thermodesulfobacterium commune]HCP10352.1 amidophosphoribosyltransferase [Thermodesulfobacterium commune]
MCGLFGIFGVEEAANYTYFGLYSLQHRGQESAGIAVYDGETIREWKALGLVSEVFNEEILKALKGKVAIGHVRYSTTGSSIVQNAQPFCVSFAKKKIAIAHNGNLVNAYQIRCSLEEEGHIFQTTMDSEVIIHLVVRNLKKGLVEAIAETMKKIKGAYSVLLLYDDTLVAFRDPWGFRPLCLGIINGGYVIASETCAFDLIGAQYLREVAPGEILVITQEGPKSYFPFKKEKFPKSHCVFEFIYFARPDSHIFGKTVYPVRKQLGKNLYKECPLEADFVMPFPDSGTYAAIGYSQASGIPLEFGMIRNHYIGRTFIQPSQRLRDLSVKMKLNPVKELIKNREIIIVDDSLVRGTTSKNRFRGIKELGPKKVHFLLSCPPIRFPCFFGIDFPSRSELIAAKHSVEEIRKFLDIDTLYYLSIEGLVDALGDLRNKLCLACFTGEYPIEVDFSFKKDIAEA